MEELVKANQEREAQEKFNQRMASLDEEYELNDEDRQVLASDIKELNDEDFESYSKKLSILLKEKNKSILAKKLEEQKEVAEEVKASEEKKEETSVEAVVEEAKADKEVEIPNSTVAEEETLVSRYQKAFDIDQFEIK